MKYNPNDPAGIVITEVEWNKLLKKMSMEEACHLLSKLETEEKYGYADA